MMRYRTEKRSDGHWVFDTYQGELCFATRTCDQTLAEQRAAALNAAYAASGLARQVIVSDGSDRSGLTGVSRQACETRTSSKT
jgi:hypothetical protein